MPLINVTDILLDSDFCELLTVQRRAESLVKGRSTLAVTTISPAPVGVVIPQNDSPMVRGPDQQNLPQLIQVHTPFRLRGASTGYQPDLIVWNGASYVVNKVQNFSHYGGGFIQADCSSMASTEPPPS